MLTSARIEICNVESRLQELNTRNKARPLDAVLVQIIWMATSHLISWRSTHRRG